MNQVNGVDVASMLIFCMVATVGLVVGFFVSSGTLWLACKTIGQEQKMSIVFSAVGTALGMTFVLNICLWLINKAVVAMELPEVALFMSIASIPVALYLTATVYAQVLELDLGRAILSVAVQCVYSSPMICMCVVPAVAVSPKLMTNIQGTMAQLHKPGDQVIQAPPAPAPEPTVVGPDPTEIASSRPAQDFGSGLSAPANNAELPVPDSVPTPDPAETLVRPDSTLPVVPEPDTAAAGSSSGLKAEAQKAFARGRFDEGYNFLYADAIASDDRDAWGKIKYCPGLGRPVLGVRWGLGVQLSGTIPPAMLTPANPNNGIGLQPAPGAAGFVPSNGPTPVGAGATTGTGLGGGLAPASDPVPADLTAMTGDIGGRLLNALPASGMSSVVGGAVQESAEYIGKNDGLAGLLQTARSKGIDALAVALLVVKMQGLSKQVDVTLSVRVFDVSTERRLWSLPQPISHNLAKQQKMRGLDPAVDLLRGLTDFINANFVLQANPRLDQAKVLERAESLANGEPTNPLAALMEIRYYQSRGFLKEPDAGACYRKLTGLNNGDILISGKPQDRRAVIDRYLPPTE